MTIRTIRWHRSMPLAAALIAAWAAASCGRNDPEPRAPSTAESTTSVRVTGKETIAWEQIANDEHQLARYRYIVFVDDVPVDLGAAKCVPSAPGSFTCSVPLPKLQPGSHRLQLVAEETDGQRRRSPKSGLLLLDVVPPNANP